MNYRRKFKGIKYWNLFSELIPRVISPITFLVLAKILGAKDYGIVGYALSIIGFCQLFIDNGISKLVFKYQKTTFLKEVFKIAIIFGISSSLILFLFAHSISEFSNEFNAEIEKVILLFTPLPLLSSLITFYQTKLIVNGDFKLLFKLRVSVVLPTSLLSIALASFGFEYKSVVLSQLLYYILFAILLSSITRNKIKIKDLIPTINITKEFLTLGAASLLTWFFTWGDTFIISKYLGIEILGTYRISFLIVTLSISSFIGVFENKMNEYLNPLNLKRLVKYKSEILLFVIAVFGLIYESGFLIQEILLQDRFPEFITVFKYMVIVILISYLNTGNNLIYVLRKTIRFEVYIYSIAIIYHIPIYLLSISHGIQYFMLARVFLIIIGLFLHSYFLSKSLKIGFLKMIVDFIKLNIKPIYFLLTLILIELIIPSVLYKFIFFILTSFLYIFQNNLIKKLQ